jgi:hypothetical protein
MAETAFSPTPAGRRAGDAESGRDLPYTRRMNALARLQAMMSDPRGAWPGIAAEPATVQSIAVGWVMILAAIGPIAALLGYGDLGWPRAARIAAGLYVTSIIVTFVLALVADVLAPSFGGRRDYVASLKLVAYSFTAVYVAGVGHVIGHWGGALVWLGALWTWYAFLLGAPLLGRCDGRRAMPYTFVMLVGWLALAAVAVRLAR